MEGAGVVPDLRAKLRRRRRSRIHCYFRIWGWLFLLDYEIWWNSTVFLAWINVFIRAPFHQRILYASICSCVAPYILQMIHRFSVRYALIKPPELPSKQASFATRFAVYWYSVLQISPGWIPSPQLTHFSITANPITSDSYLPTSEHICHLPHASHPVEKLMSIFMWEKLWTKVFMGAGVYYLCGKQGNILMDKMDECNLNKWKGSMNEFLKKANLTPSSDWK